MKTKDVIILLRIVSCSNNLPSFISVAYIIRKFGGGPVYFFKGDIHTKIPCEIGPRSKENDCSFNNVSRDFQSKMA